MAASVQTPRRSRGLSLRARRIFLLLALFAAIAAPLWHIHVINQVMPSNHADLADEWAGIRDALHGRDPYSAQGMRDTQIAYYGHALSPTEHRDPQGFPYPAYLIVLFGLVGSLSWPAFRLSFLLAVTPLFLLSIWLCLRFLRLPLTRAQTALALLLAFFSWPVLWALRLQQPTLLVAALLFIAVFLVSRKRGLLAGVLVACATVKPQLALPLLVFLLVWSGTHRLWSFVVSFLVAMAAMLAVTEHILPGWFPRWLAEVRGYSAWHGMLPLEMVLGHWPGMAATALLLLWTTWLLWGMRHIPAASPEFGLAAALALSAAVCMAPTLLATIYNQTAIIPACLILVVANPSGRYASLARTISLALLVWGYLALFLSVAGETIFGVSQLWFTLCFTNLELPVAVTIAVGLLADQRMHQLSLEPAAVDLPNPHSSGQTPLSAHTYDETFYRYIQKGAIQSAEAIVPLLTERLALDSVLDVGSGAGAWLSIYRRIGVLAVVGVDGDYVERSALLIPAANFLPRDISQPFDLGQRFSLVQCLEVGEHIPAASSRTLVSNLVRHGDRVLFSAAVPGQGGENHVNEQTFEFWRRLFAEHGYAPYDCMRPLIHDVAGIEPWYRHNILLYVAEECRSTLPPAIAATRVPVDQPIPDVSSAFYRVRTRILALLPVKMLSQIAVIKHRCILFFRLVTER